MSARNEQRLQCIISLSFFGHKRTTASRQYRQIRVQASMFGLMSWHIVGANGAWFVREPDRARAAEVKWCGQKSHNSVLIWNGTRVVNVFLEWGWCCLLQMRHYYFMNSPFFRWTTTRSNDHTIWEVVLRWFDETCSCLCRIFIIYSSWMEIFTAIRYVFWFVGWLRPDARILDSCSRMNESLRRVFIIDFSGRAPNEPAPACLRR